VVQRCARVGEERTRRAGQGAGAGTYLHRFSSSS
jgi:hypothetical protein